MTLLLAGILSAIASGIHVLIFLMESVLWPRPAVWRRFGLRSQSDADVVRPMALNQGFYNLFLAGGVVLGLVLGAGGTGAPGMVGAGHGILLFALGCMLLASVVLVLSSPRLWRAALLQGAVPLVSIVLLAVGLLSA